MKKLLFLTFLTLFLISGVYAQGFRTALQGQRQLGMGHTGVAVVSSSELIFFNPGGLTFLEEEFNASLGINPVFSNTNFKNENSGVSADTNSNISTPFTAYAAYKLNKSISVGLGIYTPYGNQVEYPTDWAGSHLVNNIELTSIFVQPTFSIKINDKMSIGGGPIYITSNLNFNRNLDLFTTDENGNRSNVTIDNSGISDWGYNLGMMFRPSKELIVGINYRSEVNVEVENGSANFQNIPGSIAPDFQNTTFNTSLPLPAELSVGISLQCNEKWLVAFDINRVFWDAFENFDVIFSNGLESLNPRNYKNATNYRLGLQYEANSFFTLRGGYYFVESPIGEGFFSPEIPKNDSNNFTAGITFNINDHFSIDTSLLYSNFEDIDASYDFYEENGETIPFGGIYASSLFVPGIGVTYNF